MKPVWTIDGEDITRLQGNSAGFVRLLDALLSRQGQMGGLSDASLRLNQKDTEGDDGVDAAVDTAMARTPIPPAAFPFPRAGNSKRAPRRTSRPR